MNARELRRFGLFLGAGAVNTCFGYAAYAVLFTIGLSYEWAVVLGTIAGVLFNYRTIGAVFAARGPSRLPRFIVIYGLLMPANVLLLRGLVRAGVGPYLGEALVIAVLAPVSFILMRRFVFASAPELAP